VLPGYGCSGIERDKPITPDLIARLANFVPSISHPIQAVVAETFRYGAYHTYWQTLGAAYSKGEISASQFLILDLLASISIAATLARVDNLGSEILVVFITARDDDGIGSVCLSATYTGLCWAVYTRIGKALSRCEGGPYLESGYVAENSFWHNDNHSIWPRIR
jgi:hypothetical protein